MIVGEMVLELVLASYTKKRIKYYASDLKL